MPNRAITRALTRASGYGKITRPGKITPRLGNLKNLGGGASRGHGVSAATTGVSWMGEGQPLRFDWTANQLANENYLTHVWVMRCAQVIATTIAELPWVAGQDPTDPATYTPASPLAKFLGPSTPQAPGGPNPRTSSRAFWAWSIIQYLVTGRFAWEAELTGAGKNAPIVALWPLVSAALAPIPTVGGNRWFQGFVYYPSTGQITMREDQVVYCWRPSIGTWRQPESVLQAAQVPVYIAKSVDKYMANLMQNDLVATTIVVGPPFAESEQRRAWQDQFMSEFTGIDRAGATIFGEMEPDETDPSGQTKYIQVERLAATPVDAGLQQAKTDAKQDICIAFGVPESLIGNASQRTYANADAEYKNFWTITLLPFISELQDHINQTLSRRLGTEVGWFDLARVEALKPPSIFMQPTITAVIATGVATVEQVANVLQIPSSTTVGDEDVTTAPLGQETANPFSGVGGMGGGGGGRSDHLEHVRMQLPPKRRHQLDLWLREAAYRANGPRAVYWPSFGVNTSTLRGLEHLAAKQAEPIEIRTISRNLEQYKHQAPIPARSWSRPARERRIELPPVGPGFDAAERFNRRALEIRAVATADRTTKKVHDYLSDNYPDDTLTWVDGATWSGPKTVDLDTIDMAQRPGGRDMPKVQGMARKMAQTPTGPLATSAVILVLVPGTPKLKVADGYHRTLAHKRVGHTKVKAMVGKVDQTEGPWDSEMHDKKLNRWVEMAAETLGLDYRSICTGPGPCDTAPIGEGKNWVTKTTPLKGLGAYARAVAHALIRSGKSKQEAIAIAIGVMKHWAAGKGTYHGTKVTANTQAQAQKELAHWEALKAKDHARWDIEPIEVRAGCGHDGCADEWHNSDGMSPDATADQLTDHLIEHHHFSGGSFTKNRDALDSYHAHDHAEHGECGAHDVTETGTRSMTDDDAALTATVQRKGAFRLGLAHQRQGKAVPLTEAQFCANRPKYDKTHYSDYLRGFKATELSGAEDDLQHGDDARRPSEVRAMVGEWSSSGPPSGGASDVGSTGSGNLLPVGPVKKPKPRQAKLIGPDGDVKGHKFKGSTLQHCEECTEPITDVVHRSRMNRHAGPGHVPAHTARGHSMRQHLASAKSANAADISGIEGGLTTDLAAMFEKQRSATLSRLKGHRGTRMLKQASVQLRATDQPSTDGTVTDSGVPTSGAAPDVSAIFDSGFWADQLQNLLAEHFAQVGQTAAARVNDQVGAGPELDSHTALQYLQTVLAGRAHTSAVQVTDTTKQHIFDQLQEGMANGESMPQLADRVNTVFDNAAGPRARMIAQTEAVGSLNQAQHAYASKLPPGTVGSKTWLSHHDDRVRPEHLLADGQQVNVTAPYYVGGYPMMYPGDQTAPPDLVINCRCGQAFLPPGLATSAIAEAVKGLIPATSQAHLNDILAAQAAKAAGYSVTADLGG